jgi:hypothetical protein
MVGVGFRSLLAAKPIYWQVQAFLQYNLFLFDLLEKVLYWHAVHGIAGQERPPDYFHKRYSQKCLLEKMKRVSFSLLK